MATLINNAGVQHYANQMLKAENRKVGSKSLPSALSDIDATIDEMKALFDAEYGSALDMKLENTENIFSVGTGSGVDKKADVENSFTDVEIKGNSLVNIYPSLDKNNYASLGNTVTISGNTISITADGNYKNFFLKKGTLVNLKPSQVYTIILDVKHNSLVCDYTNCLSLGESSANTTPFAKGVAIPATTVGKIARTIKTKSNIAQSTYSYDTRCFLTNRCLSGRIEFTYQILEGDWTNKPLPEYFEGMKSVGQDDVNGHKIEILSRNKNLFDINSWKDATVSSGQRFDINNNTVTILGYNSDTYTVTGATGSGICSANERKYLIEVKPNTTYTLSMEVEGETSRVNYVQQYNENYANLGLVSYGSSTNDKVTFTTKPNCKYVGFRIGVRETGATLVYSNILLEEGSQKTNYVNHNTNKKQISLNEPLRGVPNGVKDSIEKINGEWKIVRRCGEFTINGQKPISGYYTNGINVDKIVPYFTVVECKRDCYGISDKMPFYKYPDIKNIGKEDCVSIGNSNSGAIFVTISKSKYEDSTLQDYLDKNPINVIYELETPVIEDISPVTLQAWKNGTISIDSIIPVESTHTVALNKPAQIKRNIEELTKLRNRVEALEVQYDQIALEQAHQLELINNSISLDYDL